MVGADIDDDAAIGAGIAPAVGDVALGTGSDIGDQSVFQGHAVEMAAVFGGELADEGGLPEGCEAAARAERGEAGEAGVDEDDAAGGFDSQIVGVDVAGGVADAWDVDAVVAFMEFAIAKGVLESPDLEVAGEPERAGIVLADAQSHAAGEGAFEDGDSRAELTPSVRNLPAW